MASSAAERKAKQRQEMLEKGFIRKDIWLSKESIELVEKFKNENNLKSYDDAVNQLLLKIGNSN
jgi:hypothetical protein